MVPGVVANAAQDRVQTEPQMILDLLPQGVIVVGRDWRISYANPEAERLIGATGATLWERCPALEHAAFASGFRYAMADRTELLTESVLPSVGWCQARARPTPEGGLLISLRTHTIRDRTGAPAARRDRRCLTRGLAARSGAAPTASSATSTPRCPDLDRRQHRADAHLCASAGIETPLDNRFAHGRSLSTRSARSPTTASPTSPTTCRPTSTSAAATG
jgi:hypothetical protein